MNQAKQAPVAEKTTSGCPRMEAISNTTVTVETARSLYWLTDRVRVNGDAASGH